jgi:Uncharacterised nucleotidyltransferase
MTRLAADVLTAALHRGERGRSAWGRASSHPDFLDHAPYQLLPLLYRNLDSLGVDDPALPRLKGVYRNSWYRNQRVFAAGREALERLRASSVEALVLGGLALAAHYYRDRGARPVAAAELLVRPEDVPAAAAGLQSAGWQAGELDLRLRLTASSARFVQAERADVILHWCPFHLPVPFEEVWAQTSRLVLAGDDEWPALEPAIELMRICATAGPERGWLADGLVVARSGEVDWDRFAELAITWRMPEQGLRLAELRAEDPLAVPAVAVESALQAPRGPGDRIERMSRHAGVSARKVGSHWQRYRRLRAVDPRADGLLTYWVAVAARRGRRPFRL